jgi:hypothetical protein
VTKAQKDLAKAIVRDHYVELTSKAKLDAAEYLASEEGGQLVRLYENDGKRWAKAYTRATYNQMAEL